MRCGWRLFRSVGTPNWSGIGKRIIMSSVRVAVRARPFSDREQVSCSQLCLEMAGRNTTLYSCGERRSAKEFRFDYSYWSVRREDGHYVGQAQIYSDLGLPAVEAVFGGFNTCIFAYGQTGSGKTYTMTGSATAPGLTPRICEGLFTLMQRESSQVSYKTELSYMEIYNEKVRDLLTCQGRTGQVLRVREHPKKGPYVEGLSRHVVQEYKSVAALLVAGSLQRATASTRMNGSSSRSHAIFTLTMTQAVLERGMPSEKRSKLHLVDLAGSERASATGSEGVRLKEGGSINKSLVCLGTVISTLADKVARRGSKAPYIPYRDSVLTYLLKDSLGGNAKTIMVATVSPAASSYGESLSTLRYASRARAIVNKPVVNEDSSVKVIRELRSEIERLKAIITSQHLSMDVTVGKRITKTAGSLVTDLREKEEQVAELTREWASKWRDIRHILETRDLALHCEGAKLVVESENPHLVGIDPDILSTGLVFFYLKGESTTVGSQSANPPPDIVVPGCDVEDQHCLLVVERGRVILHPLNGDCFINHCRLTSSGRLRQGDLLQLGSSAVFRFNHPQEARRLRRRHSERLLDCHKLTNRRHCLKRNRVQSTPHTLTPLPPHSPAPSVTVKELQSIAVLKASSSSPPTISLTVPGLQQSQGSSLSLALSESQLSPMKKQWNPFALASLSPLALLNTMVAQGQGAFSSDTVVSCSAVPQSPCWWRQLLYTFLLLINAPLLVGVVGTLTVPALSMLALLLSSVKLCAVFQRFWLSRWLSTVLALLTTAAVAPVAALCHIAFRACLRLIPLPPSKSTRKTA